MRINEVDKPITQADIDQLEIFADRLFAKVGIDVEFTRHFLDRVNDERNVRKITMSELTRLFKQEFKKWGKKIAQLGPDAEAVMKDMTTDINMPFALRWDQNNQELDLIAKTVMRKNNFKTSNPEFAVESAVTDLEKGLLQFDKISYDPVDRLMKKIAKEYNITPKELHNRFKRKHGLVPDDWAHNKIQEDAGAVMQFSQFSPEELKTMAIVLGVSITTLKAMFATHKGIQQIKKAITSIGKKKKKSMFAFGESTLTEGGAMPGVGAIHIDEIEPTLIKLEKSTGLNMRDFVLGSVGKREFSGDIDIAINLKPEQLSDFADKLEKDPNFEEVTKSSVFMTKVKIENFDSDKSDGRPRTGYVQVDFMPGDPGWMKTYYHSPREDESKYKGVFRNVMIATISAVFNRQDSQKTTEDGRPLESERYMFSPRDGLVRIKRTPVPKASGNGYTKKNKNEIIEGPWRTADEIAEILNLGSGANLNSFETLLAALKKNHTPEVYAQVVKGFVENPTVQDIGVPEELG